MYDICLLETMCEKHFSGHITIHITKNVPQSPCMTCAFYKQCAKNISADASLSTSRKMFPSHHPWLVAMDCEFRTLIWPTGIIELGVWVFPIRVKSGRVDKVSPKQNTYIVSHGNRQRNSIKSVLIRSPSHPPYDS